MENNENVEETQNTSTEDANNENSAEDTTDWKAEALKNKAILERKEKKLQEFLSDDGKEKKTKKTNELGYGEKAFLVANGIKGAKETELVTNYMEQTGKSLDEVIENKYFQNELKDLRDVQAVNEAVGDPSKRVGDVAKNSVEYWIAKGELPPVSEVQLRRDVVNAKMAKSKSTGMFYNSK